MARLARIVVPDVPHHVTQRGNRRMAIFSEPTDYALYRDLLAERLAFHGVVCSAYCLMPNHVHLLLTPTRPEVAAATASLSRSVGEAGAAAKTGETSTRPSLRPLRCAPTLLHGHPSGRSLRPARTGLKARYRTAASQCVGSIATQPKRP